MVGDVAFPLDGTSESALRDVGHALVCPARGDDLHFRRRESALGPLKKAIQPRAFSSGSESLTPETQPLLNARPADLGSRCRLALRVGRGGVEPGGATISPA